MSKQTLTQRLRATGLKVTPQRLVILDVLERSTHPLSISTLLQRLAKKSADKVTVYRNLEELSARGMIRQVNLEHNHAHYELIGKTHHHHLICTNCGRIEDFEVCYSDKITASALKSAKHFKRIDRHALELFGLCTSCSAKKSTKNVS